MCLDIHPEHKKIYRAGYDILVYKRLKPAWRDANIAYSPHRNFRYNLGTRVTATFGISRFDDYGSSVYEGLHAYRTKTTALYKRYNNEQVYAATIPKGAQFIIGTRDEVVSDRLIVLKGIPKRVGRANFRKHEVVRAFK